MGRYYKTSQTDFLDYISGTPVMQPGGRPASSRTVSSLLGGIESLPEDRPVLEERVREFETQVDSLAQQLQEDPSAQQRLMPEINRLRGDIRDQYYYGEIAAIRDRYAQAQEAEKNLREVFKDNPSIMSSALQDLYGNIPELGFDPITRQYGRINPPNYVKPFTGEDRNKFIKTAEDAIKEEMIAQIDDQRPISPTETLYSLGQRSGVTVEKARESLAGMVTPDMLAAYIQDARLSGRPADERNFYDPATNTFNLNTELGRLLESVAIGLKRDEFDIDREKGRDTLAEIKERGRQRRSTMRFGRRLKAGDYENLASKFISVWRGDEGAFDNREMVDTFREGGLTEADEQMLEAIADPDERRQTREQLLRQRGREGGQIGQIAQVDNLFDGFGFTQSRAKGAPRVVQIVKRAGQPPVAIIEQEEVEYDSQGQPIKIIKVGGTARKVTSEDPNYGQATEVSRTVSRSERPFDVEFMRSMMSDEQFEFFREELEKREAIDPETQGVTVDPSRDIPIPGY